MFHVEKGENNKLVLVSDCDRSVSDLIRDVEKRLWKEHHVDLIVSGEQLALLLCIAPTTLAVITDYDMFADAMSFAVYEATKMVFDDRVDLNEDTIGEYLHPCYAAFKTFLIDRDLCFKDWNRKAFVAIVEREFFYELQKQLYDEHDGRKLIAFPSMVDPNRVLIIIDGKAHGLVYGEDEYDSLIARVKDSDILVVSIFRELRGDKYRFSIISAIFDCNKAELV